MNYCGVRSDRKAGLDNLFVQVRALNAEGLITTQRVTLGGTKIKANASGNTFRREEKLKAHLALAQEQVEAKMHKPVRKRQWLSVTHGENIYRSHIDGPGCIVKPGKSAPLTLAAGVKHRWIRNQSDPN
jgi:hypothetical protein